MRYFPVLLDLAQKSCLVVGGGTVAERKTRSLLKSGASVRVVSPALSAGLKRLLRARRIRYYRSRYRAEFLRGCFLVIIATSDRSVNARAHQDAVRRHLLINVVDVPAESNFIVPSVLERGGLLISIATGGRAPCVSKKIRQELQDDFLPRYARMLANVSRARQELKRKCWPLKRRSAALRRLLDSERACGRWKDIRDGL